MLTRLQYCFKTLPFLHLNGFRYSTNRARSPASARPPRWLSNSSSVLERWISATACAVNSFWSPLSGQLPDAFQRETGCHAGQTRIAEIRSDEFQFSLVTVLFRLRARGPPLLPLFRLHPAQTAKTETHAMHPESPCATQYSASAAYAAGGVPLPSFRRNSVLSYPFYCIGFTSDPLIIQLFTDSRNGLRRGKSPAPPTPRSLRDRTVQ